VNDLLTKNAIMKTQIITLTLLTSLFTGQLFSQDRTTVNATSSEISDNLDLRAVASIFGDSENLEDFEKRLNDPKLQISNLDLNNDNEVDYLRVIESVEGNTHLIIVQSVLERDVFQDVATIEVERDRNNRVQIQVVGDVYMYGNNYIYEPVYVHTPIIYNYFWVANYQPYRSNWYWGYYPTYYYAWTPFPIFRYRTNVGHCINTHHHYNYVNFRRSQVAYNMHRGRRSNGYETQHPNRSFSNRNANYSNRYELDRTRNTRSVGTGATRNNSTNETRNTTRGTSRTATARTNSNAAVTPRTNNRNTTVQRDASTRNVSRNSGGNNREVTAKREMSHSRISSRNGENSRTNTQRETAQPRNNSNRSSSQRETSQPRIASRNEGSSRSISQRETAQTRNNSNRSEGNSRRE
jgi:hypothetical protein